MKSTPQFLLNRALRAGLFLIWGLLSAGSLWLIFLGLGDRAAVKVFQGITCGLAVCLLVDFVFLVVYQAYVAKNTDESTLGRSQQQ